MMTMTMCSPLMVHSDQEIHQEGVELISQSKHKEHKRKMSSFFDKKNLFSIAFTEIILLKHPFLSPQLRIRIRPDPGRNHILKILGSGVIQNIQSKKSDKIELSSKHELIYSQKASIKFFSSFNNSYPDTRLFLEDPPTYLYLLTTKGNTSRQFKPRPSQTRLELRRNSSSTTAGDQTILLYFR